MNRRQVCAVSIFVLLIAGATQASDKKSTDSILAADAGWMKVFSAKDLANSVAYYDENASSLAPNAPIATGKEAITKSLSQFFALPGLHLTWHADKADVARSGELGYTSGTYQMTFSDPTGKTVSDKGKYVTVWTKQKDGSWKVALDIFNTDLPPAGAP
jgi:ketosteroid isomerase-like protein